MKKDLEYVSLGQLVCDFFSFCIFIMTNRKFAIVSFLNEDDAVAVVPEKWLIDNELCYWPSYTSQQRNDKAAKECELSNENWPKHPMGVLGTKDKYIYNLLISKSISFNIFFGKMIV